MARIPFRNQNGLRDSKRSLKNGLSPRVTAQVAALNGATVYGAGKLRNSDLPSNFDKPVSALPPEPVKLEIIDLTKRPPLNTEAKQEADTKHMSGDDTLGEGTAGPDDKNPSAGTPAVGPDGKTITNSKPSFLKKEDEEDEDEDGNIKNSTSVYPSVRGNYQSALAAMRVKLANSDDATDDLIANIDVDDGDDDESNEEPGQDNQPAATIIYGNQDLATPQAALVVTTQDPSVQ